MSATNSCWFLWPQATWTSVPSCFFFSRIMHHLFIQLNQNVANRVQLREHQYSTHIVQHTYKKKQRDGRNMRGRREKGWFKNSRYVKFVFCSRWPHLKDKPLGRQDVNSCQSLHVSLSLLRPLLLVLFVLSDMSRLPCASSMMIDDVCRIMGRNRHKARPLLSLPLLPWIHAGIK